MGKKKLRWIVIILCVILFVGLLRAALIYFGNYYPNKHCFGDEYIQVIYPTSISDYLTAKEALKEIDKAFSTITTVENAKNQFGEELGCFCITAEGAVAENHEVKFITANFRGDHGYIWIKFSSEAFNKDGRTVYGEWDCLARLELEKSDNDWIVTSFKIAP